MFADAAGKKCFPNHFPEERARIEVFGGRQVLEGSRKRSPGGWRAVRLELRHTLTTMVIIHEAAWKLKSLMILIFYGNLGETA